VNPVELSYRKTAAASGASGLGLLIAMYDTLAGSLRKAAQAERDNDIEARCKAINHALMVIGVLDDWIARGSGGELAQQLSSFYAGLRQKMVEAQVKRSAELMEKQMVSVLKIREQWQAMEFRCERSGPEILPPVQAPSYAMHTPIQTERQQFSWSA
jgi:flagellar secretion chaperone FliS